MRNGAWYLLGVAAVVVGFFVLLPLLGFVLFLLLAAVVVGAVLFFAAPLLAKLPWFRDRIHVDEEGGFRSIRFGGVNFGARTRHDGNVIDVEGREVQGEQNGRAGSGTADEADDSGRLLPHWDDLVDGNGTDVGDDGWGRGSNVGQGRDRDHGRYGGYGSDGDHGSHRAGGDGPDGDGGGDDHRGSSF